MLPNHKYHLFIDLLIDATQKVPKNPVMSVPCLFSAYVFDACIVTD